MLRRLKNEEMRKMWEGVQNREIVQLQLGLVR